MEGHVNPNINKVRREILRVYRSVDTRLKHAKKACSAGCAYCCHQNIPVHAAEEFTITAYVDEKFSLNEKLGLSARLREWFQFMNSHTPDVPVLSESDIHVFNEQLITHRVPCPFLLDAKCCIYPVRPITCRTFYVADKPEDCEANPRRIGEPRGYEHQMLGIKEAARAADAMQLRLLPYAVAQHFGVLGEIKKGVASVVVSSLVKRHA
jgi:Fe-S-cluster containining protein